MRIRAFANGFAAGILWGACFTPRPTAITRTIERLASRVYETTKEK